MEYYNIFANYTGRFTFMWSGKFNNNSLDSWGKSGNFYYQTEWEPCNCYAFITCVATRPFLKRKL